MLAKPLIRGIQTFLFRNQPVNPHHDPFPSQFHVFADPIFEWPAGPAGPGRPAGPKNDLSHFFQKSCAAKFGAGHTDRQPEISVLDPNRDILDIL